MLIFTVASFILLLLLVDMRQTVELQYRSSNLRETNAVINWLVNKKFTSYTQTVRIYFCFWFSSLVLSAFQLYSYPTSYDVFIKLFWVFVVCLELRCVFTNWKNGLGY